MATATDINDAYASAIAQAARVVEGVQPAQLDAATPCPEWNVRALLNHLIGSTLMMAAVGNGESMGEGISGTEAAARMGDVAGADPAAAYSAACSSARRAFTAPGALERPWKLPFAELPGAAALNIHLVETLAHTWDLAKATDQMAKLDPALAEVGEAVARGWLMPEFRNQKGDPFGAEVDPDGATGYGPFVAYLGRTP